MAAKKLIELLTFESEELFSGFQKAGVQGKGTPQEIADFREGYFTKFLRRYFPYPHRIAKGIITDIFDQKSASVDSIIINPVHPYTIDVSDKFSIILADGVDVAIELKPNIADKGELEVALRQVQSVKKLRRVKGPLLIKRWHSDEEIEHSKQIPSFIFSIKAKEQISDTVHEIISYYKDKSIPKNEQFDYLVILGRGIVGNHKFKDKSSLKNDKGEGLTGFSYHELGKDTLAAFLLYLNSVYHAAATFHGQILPLYLDGLKAADIQAFPD